MSMHLIGWQNTWEQAPGVPATPSPRPDDGGNPWPCTCVHGPTSSRHARNSTIGSETSTNTRHDDASTQTAHQSRRVSTVCRRRARGHDNCSGNDGASCQAVDTDVPLYSHSRLELPRHAHSHATLKRQAQTIDGV